MGFLEDCCSAVSFFDSLEKCKATTPSSASACTYVFTKGKKQGETCGKVGCKTHKDKLPVSPQISQEDEKEQAPKCCHVFTKGKNQGETCGKTNCKLHKAKAPVEKTSPKIVEEEKEPPKAARNPKLKKEGFDFEQADPVQFSVDPKWWKNWRVIQRETCGENDCKWHRTTGLVIKPEEDKLHLVGQFSGGQFIPKNQMIKAAYEWAKNSGLVI